MIDCAALLFNLDGTLIDATAVLERTWKAWAEMHSLDPQTVVAKFRGMRARDAILQLVPSAELLAEVQRLEAIELSELAAVHPLPGAAAMLAMLLPSQWAVVTSGARRLAQARLEACGLPVPDVLVSVEDVSRIKPDPEGFIAAAIRLNVDPADCIVFEDSPDGVQAGRHAGCTVVALTTTHQPADLDRADGLVKDLSSVRVGRKNGRLHISLKGAA